MPLCQNPRLVPSGPEAGLSGLILRLRKGRVHQTGQGLTTYWATISDLFYMLLSYINLYKNIIKLLTNTGIYDVISHTESTQPSALIDVKNPQIIKAKPLKDGDAKPRIYSLMAMTAGLPNSNLNRALGRK